MNKLKWNLGIVVLLMFLSIFNLWGIGLIWLGIGIIVFLILLIELLNNLC